MAQQRKKKRRREPDKKKGGVMIGMRSGFKKAARGVGVGEEKAAEKKKKSSWLNTAVTIALILAAIAILFYRNR